MLPSGISAFAGFEESPKCAARDISLHREQEI